MVLVNKIDTLFLLIFTDFENQVSVEACKNEHDIYQILAWLIWDRKSL